jgi:arylsulfatase A-like enzyme
MAGDHGEMLFDRGVTAKSRPWSSASSVPLICSGPNIARDAVVTAAVSTVDLAPTFLDFAGVLDAAPSGMSRLSMKAVMSLPERPSSAPLPRKTVELGLGCIVALHYRPFHLFQIH